MTSQTLASSHKFHSVFHNCLTGMNKKLTTFFGGLGRLLACWMWISTRLFLILSRWRYAIVFFCCSVFVWHGTHYLFTTNTKNILSDNRTEVRTVGDNAEWYFEGPRMKGGMKWLCNGKLLAEVYRTWRGIVGNIIICKILVVET